MRCSLVGRNSVLVSGHDITLRTSPHPGLDPLIFCRWTSLYKLWNWKNYLNSLNWIIFFVFLFFLLFLVMFLLFCGKDVGTNKNAFIQQCKHKVVWKMNYYFLCSYLLQIEYESVTYCGNFETKFKGVWYLGGDNSSWIQIFEVNFIISLGFIGNMLYAYEYVLTTI